MACELLLPTEELLTDDRYWGRRLSFLYECGLSQVGLALVDGPIPVCTQAKLVLVGYLKREGRKGGHEM